MTNPPTAHLIQPDHISVACFADHDQIIMGPDDKREVIVSLLATYCAANGLAVVFLELTLDELASRIRENS